MLKLKHCLPAIFLVTSLAGFSAATFAHEGCGHGQYGQRAFSGHFGEHMAKQQQALHDALKLAPDQEGAWKKFTDSMQPPAKPESGKRPDWSNLSTPERADKMLEFSKAHQERMVEHATALKAFYATLNPEQKKTFDEFHMHRPHGKMNKPAAKDGAAASK